MQDKQQLAHAARDGDGVGLLDHHSQTAVGLVEVAVDHVQGASPLAVERVRTVEFSSARQDLRQNSYAAVRQLAVRSEGGREGPWGDG